MVNNHDQEKNDNLVNQMKNVLKYIILIYI